MRHQSLRRAAPFLLVLIGAAGTPHSVLAQDSGIKGQWIGVPGSLINPSGPSTPANTFAGDPNNPLSWLDTITRTGTAGLAANAPTGPMRTTRGISDALQLRLFGRATHDGVAPADSFLYRSFNDPVTPAGLAPVQIIKLDEVSDIFVPMFLHGALEYNGVAGNRATGRVTASATLYREATAGTEDWASVGTVSIFNAASHSSDATGGLLDSINQFKLGSFGAQPGGNRRYLLTYNFQVEGDATNAAGPASAVGSSVSAKFNTDRADGFVLSASYQPTGFNLDARNSIRAEQARQQYNLNGAGIRVGVLEVFNMFGDNQTLSFGRMDTILGTDVTPNSDFRGEHATAVAGIIGSDATDLDKRGVAPNCNFDSAPLQSYTGAGQPGAMQNLIDRGSRVINMSASAGNLTQAVIDQKITASMNAAKTRDVTMAISAGNDGTPAGAGDSTITGSPLSFNSICVGALNRDFTRRAEFSSFNNSDNQGRAVDIVAPGEYIQSVYVSDINGDNALDQRDYGRNFLGNGYATDSGALTGAISGTSFSAPFVSGAAALMQQLADRKGYESDHRVIKAVMLAGASNKGITRSDADGVATIPWTQKTQLTGPNNNVLQVRRSLDRQLGAGALDVAQAMRILDSGEINASDNNTAQHKAYDASSFVPSTTVTGNTSPGGWDRESVAAQAGADPGTIDYELGDITGQHLRALLTWDFSQTLNRVPHLELYLMANAVIPGAAPGTTGGAGIFIAFTDGQNPDENVKLFDIDVRLTGDVPGLMSEEVVNYYLQVRNLDSEAVTYGLAFQIPTPGGAITITLCVCVAARRRRRAA